MEWWADATPAKKEIFQLPASLSEYAVSFCRISGGFLSTMRTGADSELADIRAEQCERTNRPENAERIFELMLRLRANTFWPAMHGC